MISVNFRIARLDDEPRCGHGLIEWACKHCGPLSRNYPSASETQPTDANLAGGVHPIAPGTSSGEQA